MVAMRTAHKICSMPGCEQEIYLRPDERDLCEACRLRGGPPPPPVAHGETQGPADWGPITVCHCGRPVLDPQRTGDQCMRCHRESKQG